MSSRAIRLACGLAGILCGCLLAAPGWALTPAETAAMRDAAQGALHQCLALMHHDTDEFSACVDARLAAARAMPAAALGASYVGAVGCVSAGRMGTLHSDSCSQRYLHETAALQRRLRVSDEALCPLVPGDCRSRNARIAALRAGTR